MTTTQFGTIFQKGVAGGAMVLLATMMASCSGGGSKKGLPTNLPTIALNSTSATPAHNMPSYSYPFDSGGNYVSSWAAEGERRAGRSAANSSDARRWGDSHGSSRSSSSSASRSKTKAKTKVTTTGTKRKSSSSSGSRSHAVKKGDTLYGIARRYGTTVAKIKAANGLRSDMIRPGSSLRIPR